MDIEEYLSRSGLRSMVPLIQRLVWPLPVEVKSEPKEETVDESEYWSEEEIKCVFKQEITEDPLKVNDCKQEVKAEPKEETVDQSENWSEEEIKCVFKQEIAEDPLKINYSKQEKRAITPNPKDVIVDGIKIVHPCKSHDVTSKSSRLLEKHVKTCRKDQEVIESIPLNLKKLARFVNGKKIFFCQSCEYKTEQFTRLKRHFTTHTGARNYKCSSCDKTFTQSHHLATHQATHRGELVKPRKQNRSKKNNLINPGKQISCKLCSYKTDEEAMLKRHMLVHTGEKPHACTKCEFRSSQNSSLIRHIRRKHSDNNEGLLSCAHCAYNTFDKHTIKYHMAHKHQLSELNFNCTECDFKADYEPHFKQHMKLHKGQEPLSCAQCGFRAAHKTGLQRHIKVKHTADPNLRCNMCGFRTVQVTSLKKHKLSEHPDKIFSCCHCQYKTSLKKLFCKHMKRKHKDT